MNPLSHKAFLQHFTKHYNMVTDLPGSLYWGWLLHNLMNSLDKRVNRHHTNCSYQVHEHLLIRRGCRNHLQLYIYLETTSSSRVKCCSHSYRGADTSLALPGRKQATFPTFYGTWRFITTFTRVHHLSLP